MEVDLKVIKMSIIFKLEVLKMVDYKNKYRVYKAEEDKEYICTIECVDKDEYYVYDTEREIAIEILDNNDILELMFMHEIERRSELTGRPNLYISVIE